MEQDQKQTASIKTTAAIQNKKLPGAKGQSKSVVTTTTTGAAASAKKTTITPNSKVQTDNKNKKPIANNAKKPAPSTASSTTNDKTPKDNSSKSNEKDDRDEGNSDESWEKDFDIADTK